MEPWPTFLIKECDDILLPPVTRLINFLLPQGHVTGGFKSHPRLKNPHHLLIILRSIPSGIQPNFPVYKLFERVAGSYPWSQSGLLAPVWRLYMKRTLNWNGSVVHEEWGKLVFGQRWTHCLGSTWSISCIWYHRPFHTPLNCIQRWLGVGGFVNFFVNLTVHVQAVKLGSTLSDLCKLSCGVPQGSALGHFLFFTTPLMKFISQHTGAKFFLYMLMIHFYCINTSSPSGLNAFAFLARS